MSGYQTGLGNQLRNDGLWSYTYDNERNLIKKSKSSSLETWQYGYDNLNHLTWAKDEPTDGGSPTLIATYIYDVFGNRLEKDVWTSAGGNLTTRYGYDGEKVWSDLNGSNQFLTRYLEGDQAGPPLARISAASVAGWYLADHLNSVRNISDNTGTLIDTIAYDAYGKLTNETSPSNGDRYKWATLQFDNETGLYHAWARDELPPVGRWIQQDPEGFAASDNNLYRYVANNPVGALDVLGLDAVTLQIRGVEWPIVRLRKKVIEWGFTATLKGDFNNKTGNWTDTDLSAIEAGSKIIEIVKVKAQLALGKIMPIKLSRFQKFVVIIEWKKGPTVQKNHTLLGTVRFRVVELARGGITVGAGLLPGGEVDLDYKNGEVKREMRATATLLLIPRHSYQGQVTFPGNAPINSGPMIGSSRSKPFLLPFPATYIGEGFDEEVGISFSR